MATPFPLTRALARDVPGGSRTKGRLYPLDGAAAADPEFAPPRRGASQPPWERFLTDFARHLSSDARPTRASRFAGAQLVYAIDRAATLATGIVAIDLMTRGRRKSGEWAK